MLTFLKEVGRAKKRWQSDKQRDSLMHGRGVLIAAPMDE